MKSKLDLLLPLLITTVVAILGWLAVDYLNSQRDFKNKRREVRTEFLIRAYQRVEACAWRGQNICNTDYGKDFESAIADIQLFGTEDQVRLAKQLSTDIATPGKAARIDDLLVSLRNALREELDLGCIEETPGYLRLRRGLSTNNVPEDTTHQLSDPQH